MNTKITFISTMHYDESQPNNGFNEEKDFIVCGDGYTFDDWLSDQNVRFNQDEDDTDTYFVLDDDLSAETRTGEAYMIISEEPTEEELKA